MRIHADGTPIDPEGFAIAPEWPLHQWDPTVSCIGTRCLFVWQQDDRGPAIRSYDPSTHQKGPARLLSDARSAPWKGVLAAIANDGERFLVVWEAENPDRVAGRLVDADGRPLGAELVFFGARGRFNRLVYNQGTYGLFFMDDSSVFPRNVVARFIGRDGGVFNGSVVGRTALETQPGAIAPTPTGFVFAFGHDSTRLAFRRFSLTGAPLDASPVFRSSVTGVSNPGLASFGDHLTAVWTLPGETRIEILSAASLDDYVFERQLSSGAPNQLRFASGELGGRNLLVAFSEGELFLTPVEGRTGAVAPTNGGFGTRVTEDTHRAPRALVTPDRVYVGWNSLLGKTGENRIRVFDRRGNPQTAGLRLHQATQASRGFSLLEVSGQPWAAWGSETAVVAGPVSGDGTVPTVFLAGVGSTDLGVVSSAALGDRMLLAWSARYASSEGTFFSVLNSNGSLVLGTQQAAQHSWSDSAPAVAASVDRFLLASFDGTTLAVRLLDAQGNVVSNSVGTLSAQSASASAASDGRRFAIAYAVGVREVEVRIIQPDGTIEPANRFSITDAQLLGHDWFPLNPSQPNIVFDGHQFAVTYSHVTEGDGGVDLRRRVFFVDGGVGPWEVVNDGLLNQTAPAVAQRNGQTVTTWIQGHTTSGLARIFVQAEGGDGGVEDSGPGATDAGGFGPGGDDAGPNGPAQYDAGATLDSGLSSENVGPPFAVRQLTVRSGCAVPSGESALGLGVWGWLMRCRRKRRPLPSSVKNPSR
jgi:hypothetical protein